MEVLQDWFREVGITVPMIEVSVSLRLEGSGGRGLGEVTSDGWLRDKE
jgi:hypothetical protein